MSNAIKNPFARINQTGAKPVGSGLNAARQPVSSAKGLSNPYALQNRARKISAK